jgi:hypothetical protein
MGGSTSNEGSATTDGNALPNKNRTHDSLNAVAPLAAVLAWIPATLLGPNVGGGAIWQSTMFRGRA